MAKKNTSEKRHGRKKNVSLVQTAATPFANRALGQNFLFDGNITRKIVELAQISSEDFIVEIGPGPGALTNVIQSYTPKKLLLIERDFRFACERKESLAPSQRHLVVFGDALLFSWNKFNVPFTCIGNLPYNIASPFMWDILSSSAALQKAVFMIQKEVAQRIVACPKSAEYGLLTVWLQSYMNCSLKFIVPPTVFRPRPKVDSAVMLFTPLEAEKRPRFPHELATILKLCFQMRRKQLGSIFKLQNLPLILLEQTGISPQSRPEEISVSLYHSLSEKMHQYKNTSA